MKSFIKEDLTKKSWTHYLITLIFLSIGLTVLGQDQGLDESKQYKKTRVSTETLMGYGIDQYGKALDIGTKKSTRLFDENGNMTTLIEYNAKSEPVSRTVLKYSKNNQISAGFEYKGYDKLIEKYTISYSKEGNKIRKSSILDSSKYEIEYKYDAKSNLIEKTKYASNKEKVYTYNYIYSTENLLKKELYASKGISLEKEFDYDSVGHLIKEKNKTDKLQGYTFVFEYDSVGNKIKETEYSLENIAYEWFEYAYTEDKMIKTILKYNFRGDISYAWRYFYDAKKNLEFVKIYEGKDQKLVYITHYLYKYFSAPVIPTTK